MLLRLFSSFSLLFPPLLCPSVITELDICSDPKITFPRIVKFVVVNEIFPGKVNEIDQEIEEGFEVEFVWKDRISSTDW